MIFAEDWSWTMILLYVSQVAGITDVCCIASMVNNFKQELSYLLFHYILTKKPKYFGKAGFMVS
jgi:hypothetical protein